MRPANAVMAGSTTSAASRQGVCPQSGSSTMSARPDTHVRRTLTVVATLEEVRHRHHRPPSAQLRQGGAHRDWIARLIAWEEEERRARSLKRRLADARLGQFKTLADFDWERIGEDRSERLDIVPAQLAFDPDGASARGLSLGLTQDWGGQAAGGLDTLFAADPLEDRTGMAESRWVAEAAYGLPVFGGRFTGSPHMGLGLATGARDYTLGWRLEPAANAPAVSFGVQATRRESDGTVPEHTIGFEINAQW